MNRVLPIQDNDTRVRVVDPNFAGMVSEGSDIYGSDLDLETDPQAFRRWYSSPWDIADATGVACLQAAQNREFSERTSTPYRITVQSLGSSTPIAIEWWGSIRACLPSIGQFEQVREDFQKRLDDWKEETASVSSTTEMVLNSHYQRIIGMGSKALPLLLKALQDEPCWLFWALKAITDEDPVAAEDRGDLAAMTKAWINWGIARGIIGKKSEYPPGVSETCAFIL